MDEELTNEVKKVNLDEKLQQELSFKDNKEDVKKVVENAIEVKVGGLTAKNEDLLNSLVEDKSKILKDQSKAEVNISKQKKETELTEAITNKDRAFFERYKQLLEKANITSPCARNYMLLMLCIIVPFSFVTNLISLIVKIPFEIITVLTSCIDVLAEKIASFSKHARIISVSLLVILVVAGMLYIAYSILNKLGYI